MMLRIHLFRNEEQKRMINHQENGPIVYRESPTWLFENFLVPLISKDGLLKRSLSLTEGMSPNCKAQEVIIGCPSHQF